MSDYDAQRTLATEPDSVFDGEVSRRRLEEALQESEEKFRVLTDALPQLVWSSLPDGTSDFFNGRWQEYVGAEEIVAHGRGWERFLHPEDVGRTAEVWDRCLRTGEPYQIEYRIRRHDGVYRWFIGRGLPWRDAQGNIQRWFGTCTDIDDQKRAEEALKLREEHYRMLADSIPSIGLMATPEGGCVYINQQWYDYTGLSEEETLGRGWLKSLHPDDAERTMREWQSVTESGGIFEIEYRFRDKQGVYRWFLGKIVPMKDTEGRVVRYFGTLTNIDRQKQTEETLREQQQEIAALNVRLKRAMTETHHRVKNNLQMISALIEVQRTATEDSETSVALNRLVQNVRALGTIHDILTQEAKTDGEAHTLSAKVLLERLLDVLQQTARNRRLVYRVEDVRLWGRQATTLALIVNELVSNAMKHGRGNINIRFFLSKATANLEVEDDGTGFTAEFDPIIAANTGLELIENMTRWDLAGSTFYENRAEGGARVKITFPITSSL